MRCSYLKKLTFVFVIFISFIVVMWGVAPYIAGAAGKKPVKIGVLTPLSPPGDPIGGKRILWGAELGAKYVNEVMGGVLGGRPVELVVEDDSGVPADGIAGYRKLVQRDNVAAVVGQYHSSVCLAVTKVSKELGTALFSSAASSPKITGTQSPTIFSNMSLTPDRSKFWVEWAKASGLKRIVVLGEDTDYGTGFCDWVRKYGEEAGLEVKTLVFPRTAPDLTPALLEAKAWKPDLLINVGVGAASYLMVKQAYDIGLFPQVPMLASYAWPVRPEFWKAVKGKGKYILYTAYYKPGMPITPMGEWMIPKFKALHNEAPDFYPLNAYGQILIVAQAINLAQSADPKAVIEALRTYSFVDWGGVVKYEEPQGIKWHNVSPPHLILQSTDVGQSYKEAHMVWPPRFGGEGKINKP